MGKIDLESAPKGQGTRYPAPYDARCKDRKWVRLGDAAGLTQFGVNLVTLEPGVWSSQRHWHEKEDEFVYVIEGELTLVTDDGQVLMHPGDCAGFRAGVRNGHVLQNRTHAIARFIVVGSRDDSDWGEYSDIDMKFHSGRYSAGGGYTKKNGEPLSRRLAVFDLDGTLVDSRRAIGDAIRGAWEALDLEPPSYDATRRIVGLSLLEAMQALAPNLPAARYPELSVAYKSVYLKNREAGLHEPLYDGARETLTSLKDSGWSLGLATGKSRRGIEHIFSHHNIGDMFSAAFCADDGPGKPDPHMLRLNMEALGFSPADTVMIGDTSFDMAMARAASCYALGVTWGFHTRDEVEEGGAHEIVEAFPDMGTSLARWRAGA